MYGERGSDCKSALRKHSILPKGDVVSRPRSQFSRGRPSIRANARASSVTMVQRQGDRLSRDQQIVRGQGLNPLCLQQKLALWRARRLCDSRRPGKTGGVG
jgi:hypothetical protein